MFIGGLSNAVIEQVFSLLPSIDTDRVFICCSGSFRSERTIHLYNPAAKLYSNDVSFYSCVLGGWLADEPVDFRFTGELEFLETLLEGAEPIRRAAAVAFALDVTNWASGKQNPYKAAHIRELTNHAETYITALQAKLAGAFGEMRLAGFAARDWIEHMDQGLAEGATIVTFPPFYKGGYERLYKWLDAHVEWARPAYQLFDPKNLGALVDRIRDSEVPYIFISDQLLPGHEPRTLWRSPANADCWLYASSGRASLRRTEAIGKPVAYLPLDPSKLTARSEIRIERTDSSSATYIRTIYLQTGIVPAPGKSNFFVLLDGMLAGVLSYGGPSVFTLVGPNGQTTVYLMSDVATSRQMRLSKLITRLALNREILDDIAAELLRPILHVNKTAFSNHPVSMKYRGIFDLVERKDAIPPKRGFQLQYAGERLDETIGEAFGWWWKNHVEPKDRNAKGGSKARPGRGGRR